MIKRILLIAVAIAVVAQFFQPDRSAPAVDPSKDMLAVTGAPADVRDLVVGACYDCHSDATQYPWYSRITPVNFIMQHHINEGREALNFSRWDKFAASEAAGECGEEIREGEMPPGYYRRMHDHGRLTAAQQDRLVAWFDANVQGKESAEAGEGDGRDAGRATESEGEEEEGE